MITMKRIILLLSGVALVILTSPTALANLILVGTEVIGGSDSAHFVGP